MCYDCLRVAVCCTIINVRFWCELFAVCLLMCVAVCFGCGSVCAVCGWLCVACYWLLAACCVVAVGGGVCGLVRCV